MLLKNRSAFELQRALMSSFAMAFLVLSSSGCGGGGSAAFPATSRVTATPTPPPTCPPSGSCTFSLAANVPLPIPALGGFSGTFKEPTNNAPAGTTVTLKSYTGAPAGAPAPLAIARARLHSGPKVPVLSSSAGAPIFWVSHTYSASATFNGFPSFQWQLPSSVSASGPFELETFDGTTGSLLEVENDNSVSGGLVSFPGYARAGSFTEVAGHTYWWELITGFASPPSHLYLSVDGDPGGIGIYGLPIGGASAPVAAMWGDRGPVGMAFDAMDRLFVANERNGKIQVFAQPITNGATPTFTLSTGHVFCGGYPRQCYPGGALDVAFDAAGDLFVAGRQPYKVNCDVEAGCWPVFGGRIYEFTAPVTSSSSPSLTLGEISPLAGIAFDSRGNLWATNLGALEEYVPPFNASSTPAISVAISPCCGVAFDSAGNMYVGNSTSGVDVFKPPFSASMTKAFTIISGPRTGYIAFDTSGSLYTTALDISGNYSVFVFLPPFSGSSVPVVMVPVTSGIPPPGIAVGP